MNEDKIVEKFSKGAAQMGVAIIFFFFASAATATDPFFRKNMGERYLSLPRIVISAIGWGALVLVTYWSGKTIYGSTPFRALVSGIIILLAYLAFSVTHHFAVMRRRQTGAYWHSKSRGESLFGSENTARDLIIEGVVTVVLFFGSPLYALFFAISRVLGYASEAMARKLIYNKYLDIQDAKIEAEFMEVALRDGLAPCLTAGYYMPLSNDLKGEQRANVARVVSDGMREITGFRLPTQDQLMDPTPHVEQYPAVIERVQQPSFSELMAKARGALSGLKLGRLLPFLVGLAIVMTAAGGVFLLSRSADGESAVTTAQPQGGSEGSPTESMEVKKSRERRQGLELIKESISAQEKEIMAFTAICQGRFTSNTARIEKLPRSQRTELSNQNKKLAELLVRLIKVQATELNQLQKGVDNIILNPLIDASHSGSEVAGLLAKMQEDRNVISTELDSLDASLAKPPEPQPKRKKFLIF